MARILVIDDETDVRITVREILERAGFDVDTAGDGREGLDKMREKRADLAEPGVRATRFSS